MGEYSCRPINWNRVNSDYKSRGDKLTAMRNIVMNNIVKSNSDYSNERRSFWSKKLNNAKLGCMLADRLSNIYEEKNAIEVYNFIESLFLINGFDSVEVVKYINSNVNLLLLDKSRIVQILSILKSGNLDNIVLFNMPSVFFESISLSKLYSASLKNANSENLDKFCLDIKSEEESEVVSSIKISKLITLYMKDFKDKKEALKESMRLSRG